MDAHTHLSAELAGHENSQHFEARVQDRGRARLVARLGTDTDWRDSCQVHGVGVQCSGRLNFRFRRSLYFLLYNSNYQNLKPYFGTSSMNHLSSAFFSGAQRVAMFVKLTIARRLLCVDGTQPHLGGQNSLAASRCAAPSHQRRWAQQTARQIKPSCWAAPTAMQRALCDPTARF